MANPISRRELIRRFRNPGVTGPISGGRHQFVEKEGGSIDGALVKEILRQAVIKIGDWDKA